MNWLLKTNSTPFGTPNNNSHWKTSSPMASPPVRGESYVELEMDLPRKYGTYLKKHLEMEHPKTKGKINIKMKGGSKNE